MSQIPDDIDRIATAIVRDPLDKDGDPDFDLYLRIANAIVAERERCARIAEHWRARIDISDLNARETIIAAIRGDAT